MLTLFDVLHPSEEDSGFSDDVERQRTHSIQRHLSLLLNARQGVLNHLPDYGLPDINKFYRELPYSESDLATTVKAIIEKYEPRLKQVFVRPLQRDIQFSVVRIEILGQIVGGGRVRFQTYFKSTGEAEVLSPMTL